MYVRVTREGCMTPKSKGMLFNWWVWSELYVRPLCVCQSDKGRLYDSRVKGHVI